MLRSLLLDMGNVLIRFDPELFLDRLKITDEADRAMLLKGIFQSPDWPLLDLGELDEAGLEERVLLRLPKRLFPAAHQLIFGWDDPIVPIPGMAELLGECRAAGLSIYLLSNASVRQSEYWPRIPRHEQFDGVIVSAFCGCVKPSAEIFRLALDRFSINAEECLFVDGVSENVSGAEAVGIQGFLFTGDVGALRQKLKGMGVQF